MLRVLHTSDLHLDFKFSYLSKEKRIERRLDQLGTLTRIVKLSIENDVNFLIISGDLFDTDYPSKSTLSFVIDEFQKLHQAKISVLISPGDCDPIEDTQPANITSSWLASSIYESPFPPNVSVFTTPYLSPKVFADYDIAFYGAACTKDLKNFRVMSELPEKKTTKYHFAILHGCYEDKFNKVSKNCHLFNSQELQRTFFDYVAMGHYHGYFMGKEGRLIIYSGTPESLDFDSSSLGDRYVILSELNDQKQSKIIKVNCKNYCLEKIQCDFLSSLPVQRQTGTDQISNIILEKHDPKKLLKLVIEGRIVADTNFSTEEVLKRCYDAFFHMEIHTDLSAESQAGLSTEQACVEPIPNSSEYQSLRSIFVHIIKERLAYEKDPDERKKLKESLLIGLNALNKEV